LKKIKFKRLPADLALKLGDPPLCNRQRIDLSHRIRHDRGRRWRLRRRQRRQNSSLARTTWTAERVRATKPETITPHVKMLPQNAELARQSRDILPGFHPSQRRKLNLPAVSLQWILAHQFS
jgi:hypothetical protein